MVNFDQKSLCGNGIVEGDEQCDPNQDGETIVCNDGSMAKCVACRYDCKDGGYCGDGKIEGEEECETDMMGDPSDVCANPEGAICENCHWVCATCGDGNVGDGEGAIRIPIGWGNALQEAKESIRNAFVFA
jgi:hypothetical protein